MSKYLWIGLMGFLGTLTRYWLGGVVSARTASAFPWGTFVVNASGAFLLGFLATVGVERGLLPPTARIALTVGFLGAYTTFSTWTLETLRLLESGSYLLALLNVSGSVFAGILGVWAGVVIGRYLG